MKRRNVSGGGGSGERVPWEHGRADSSRGVTRAGGKGEDARMRFNKCHRPQVGDVLAPQSRLRGVRFPRDLDNSGAPGPASIPVSSLNERVVGRASVSCSTHAYHTDSVVPYANGRDDRDDAGAARKFRIRRLERVDVRAVQMSGGIIRIGPRPPSRLVSSAEPSCRSARPFTRRPSFHFQKSFNSPAIFMQRS